MALLGGWSLYEVNYHWDMVKWPCGLIQNTCACGLIIQFHSHSTVTYTRQNTHLPKMKVCVCVCVCVWGGGGGGVIPQDNIRIL